MTPDPIIGLRSEWLSAGGHQCGLLDLRHDRRRADISIRLGVLGSKNKANAEVRELARTYTTVAIKTLAALMLSKETDDLTRYHAAEALLNRGWGRPATAIAGEGDTGPAKVELT